MSVAALVAVSAALFNAATALLHVGMSRAPGFRASRVFAVIAGAAVVYGLCDATLAWDGLPDAVYVAGAKLNYLAAAVHIGAWWVYAFGGPDASFRAMGRSQRWVVAGLLTVSAILALTGAHMQPTIELISLPWAGTHYHYPQATPLGDVYGLAMFALLLPPFVSLVRRTSEPGGILRSVGLVVFVACSLEEVSVANRYITFLSLGDFGFLTVVLTSTYGLAVRFARDARRLDALTRAASESRATPGAPGVPLAALGRLAAGVGHEINNPLAFMTLGLERVDAYARGAEAPEDVRDAIGELREGARRIAGVVAGLRAYTLPTQGRAPVPLAARVREAVDAALPELARAARVEVEADTDVAVLVDGDGFTKTLLALLKNAGQAVASRGSAHAGHITVRVRELDGERALVEIEDDGIGLDPAQVARVGEPYFTTRQGDGALGLGLFFAHGFAVAHGGQLELTSVAGAGTRVRLVLERANAAHAESPPSTPLSAPIPTGSTGARRRVLLVDDEPLVLKGLARSLSREWEVVTAADGTAAIRTLESERFDAMVSDVMMPGVSGIQLEQVVAERWPALRGRMLFVTGGAGDDEAQAFLSRRDVQYMLKPVVWRELSQRLNELVAGASSSAERRAKTA